MRTALVVSVVLNVFLAWTLVFSGTGSSQEESPPPQEAEAESRALSSSGNLGMQESTPSARDSDRQIGPEGFEAVDAGASGQTDSRIDSFGNEAIPALPGLAGFDLRRFVPPTHPAELLAAEIEDFGWAAEMEGRILTAIQEASDGTFNQVEVECRMTRCGLVVGLTADGETSIRNAIDSRLREAFDLQGTSRHGMGRPDGSRFVAIYFQVER